MLQPRPQLRAEQPRPTEVPLRGCRERRTVRRGAGGRGGLPQFLAGNRDGRRMTGPREDDVLLDSALGLFRSREEAQEWLAGIKAEHRRVLTVLVGQKERLLRALRDVARRTGKPFDEPDSLLRSGRISKPGRGDTTPGKGPWCAAPLAAARVRIGVQVDKFADNR